MRQWDFNTKQPQQEGGWSHNVINMVSLLSNLENTILLFRLCDHKGLMYTRSMKRDKLRRKNLPHFIFIFWLKSAVGVTGRPLLYLFKYREIRESYNPRFELVAIIGPYFWMVGLVWQTCLNRTYMLLLSGCYDQLQNCINFGMRKTTWSCSVKGYCPWSLPNPAIRGFFSPSRSASDR